MREKKQVSKADLHIHSMEWSQAVDCVFGSPQQVTTAPFANQNLTKLAYGANQGDRPWSAKRSGEESGADVESPSNQVLTQS